MAHYHYCRWFLAVWVAFFLMSPAVGLSQPVPFETIIQGEISYFRYNDPGFVGADMVIRDPKTWVWFWKKHTQGVFIPPPLPRIDFYREMVLVAMLGFQTSGRGPKITIVAIEELPVPDSRDNIKVRSPVSKGIQVLTVENRQPGHLDIITNPFHIIKVRNYPSVLFIRQPAARPCLDTPECRDDEYCQKKPGECKTPGFCVARPDACPEIYAPVCGCDGETYENECAAAMKGVSVLHEGECRPTCTKSEDCHKEEFCLFPEGLCSGPGLCALKPHACPLYYFPVCGCDKKTYGNDCEAYANGMSILYWGECK